MSVKSFWIHGNAALAPTQTFFSLTPSLCIFLLSGHSTQMFHPRLQLSFAKLKLTSFHSRLTPPPVFSFWENGSSSHLVVPVTYLRSHLYSFFCPVFHDHSLQSSITSVTVIWAATVECLLYFGHLGYFIVNPHKFCKIYIVII